MIGFEEYLELHPRVARSRAERIRADEEACIFLHRKGYNYALMPERGYSSDLVEVNLKALTCQCNVFRTKDACPHIAAALGIIERHGGKIPYADAYGYVMKCLEKLKSSGPRPESVQDSYSGFSYYDEYGPTELFSKRVSPVLDALTPEEKSRFLMQLASCLETPQSPLTIRAFRECFDSMASNDPKRQGHDIARTLFQHRQECPGAVVALLREYICPFSVPERTIIVQEIAASDALTERFFPALVEDYSAFFSRQQLLDHYDSIDQGQIPGMVLDAIMKRMVEETPPLYDAFLKIYNQKMSYSYYPNLTHIANMIQAGYGDQMEKLIGVVLGNLRTIDDYFKLAQVVPHDLLLVGWRDWKRSNRYPWKSMPSDLETELYFRIDPENAFRIYDLEPQSFHILEVILNACPDYRKEVNTVVRKIYRKAMRSDDHQKAADALMLLVRGEDSIAVKYAAEWDISRNRKADLVYLAVVGTHFDSLQKLVPGLTKMEVTHAAGQN